MNRFPALGQAETARVACSKGERGNLGLSRVTQQRRFRAKLDVTDAAVVASNFAHPNPNAWPKLKERCRKKSLRRNNIAHGTLCYSHTEKNLSRRFFVATPDKEGSVQERDYINDISSLRDAFQLLEEDLCNFYFDIEKILKESLS